MAYAEQSTLGMFKKNTCIDLVQTCDNCTYVNFSVVSPTSQVLLSSANGSQIGTIYNKTFCNTTLSGLYKVMTTGDIDGVITTMSYSFEINPSGISRVDNPIGIIVPIFSLLINFFILLLSLRKQILQNEITNFILRRSLMVFGIWLLVLNSGIMASVAEYAGLDLTREMYMFVTIFGWGGYIAMLILVFSSAVQFMSAWKIQKANKRVGNYEQ
jgi:hypothetical protein